MFKDKTKILFVDYSFSDVENYANVLESNNAQIEFLKSTDTDNFNMSLENCNVVIVDSENINSDLIIKTKAKKIPVIGLAPNINKYKENKEIEYLANSISPESFLAKLKNIITKINKKEQSISQNNVIILEIDCDKSHSLKSTFINTETINNNFVETFINKIDLPMVIIDNNYNLVSLNDNFNKLLKLNTNLNSANLTKIFPDIVDSLSLNKNKDQVFFRHYQYDNNGEIQYYNIQVWKYSSHYALLTIFDKTDYTLSKKQRDDFVFTLIHDIKNPIVSCGKIIDHILGNKATLPEILDILKHFQKSNTELVNLLNNMSEIAKYQAKLDVLNLADYNLKSIVLDSIDSYYNSINSKNLTLNLNLENLTVICDIIAIKRVIGNLLDNAIKFSKDNSSINISLLNYDNGAKFSITNFSAPISRQEQKFIFQHQFQGKNGRMSGIGNGLGLYLCQQIIDAHKGKINCTSSLNETTFSIWLKSE